MREGTLRSHSLEVVLASASHARTTGPTRRAGRVGAFVFKSTNGRRQRAGRAGWARPMTCGLSALTDRRTHTHSATRAPPCPTRAARSSAGRIVRSPTPRRPASPLRARFSPSPGPGPAQCAAPPGGLRRGKNHASLSLGECPYPAPSCRDEASASLATLRMITMAAAAAVVRAPWQEARAPCLKTVLSGL